MELVNVVGGVEDALRCNPVGVLYQNSSKRVADEVSYEDCN